MLWILLCIWLTGGTESLWRALLERLAPGLQPSDFTSCSTWQHAFRLFSAKPAARDVRFVVSTEPAPGFEFYQNTTPAALPSNPDNVAVVVCHRRESGREPNGPRVTGFLLTGWVLSIRHGRAVVNFESVTISEGDFPDVDPILWLGTFLIWERLACVHVSFEQSPASRLIAWDTDTGHLRFCLPIDENSDYESKRTCTVWNNALWVASTDKLLCYTKHGTLATWLNCPDVEMVRTWPQYDMLVCSTREPSFVVFGPDGNVVQSGEGKVKEIWNDWLCVKHLGKVEFFACGGNESVGQLDYSASLVKHIRAFRQLLLVLVSDPDSFYVYPKSFLDVYNRSLQCVQRISKDFYVGAFAPLNCKLVAMLETRDVCLSAGASADVLLRLTDEGRLAVEPLRRRLTDFPSRYTRAFHPAEQWRTPMVTWVKDFTDDRWHRLLKKLLPRKRSVYVIRLGILQSGAVHF
eukprot:TRINITY_DN5062_c0_g1_i2.p1 TRINITY_DN5062_c0_g1~~TRINITY_DN5062_c0_g1_i2.p1  ORF type:complete len:463 (-),score=112.83 TRINITY_DN5062_c0_g1_i2:121-1509(-)